MPLWRRVEHRTTNILGGQVYWGCRSTAAIGGSSSAASQERAGKGNPGARHVCASRRLHSAPAGRSDEGGGTARECLCVSSSLSYDPSDLAPGMCNSQGACAPLICGSHATQAPLICSSPGATHARNTTAKAARERHAGSDGLEKLSEYQDQYLPTRQRLLELGASRTSTESKGNCKGPSANRHIPSSRTFEAWVTSSTSHLSASLPVPSEPWGNNVSKVAFNIEAL